MRRVSSRQRLVSWDAFDAAAAETDEEEQDFVTCYEASLSRNSSFALEDSTTSLMESINHDNAHLHPLRRKRERPSEPSRGGMKKVVSFSDLVPVVISAHAWEVLPVDPVLERLVEKPSLLPPDKLIDDVQLHILSFLSAAEARDVALVSKHYRRLLHSKEAMTLWKEWFQRRWPSQVCHTSMQFVDLLELPTALMNTPENQPNMSVLLGMAARHFPTDIDKSLLAPQPLRRLRHTPTTPKRTMFRTFENEGHTVVQYTGPIGMGDRCIRANQPLSGPERIGLWSSFANKVSKKEW
jgi:hypothetical protein